MLGCLDPGGQCGFQPELLSHCHEPPTLRPPMTETEENEKSPHEPELERIIEMIRTTHNFDVRGYKRSTLYRRIRKRIADSGVPGLEEYRARLEADRLEFTHLINTILINVTEFFRDPEAWQYVQEECLRPLIHRRGTGQPLRFWSVGCATGQEPYSLAICLAELLEDRNLREVKIYATDLDEEALTRARAGIYGPDDMRNVSPERRERYFEELPGGHYLIRRELRSSVIFGRHNALVDPPISRQDLLICRNLLIYFDTATQQQLLPRFHYALREEGYLFLGKAETLMSRSMLFRPLEPRFRVFQRVPQEGPAEALLGALETRKVVNDPGSGKGQDLQNYTLHALVDQAIDPLILLDASGRITMASTSARELFRLKDLPLGMNVAELDESLRPMALRLAIEDARTTGRPTEVEEVRLPHADGSPRYLQLRVCPILEPNGGLIQMAIWARDLTEEHHLADELIRARQELETVSEELQTTNEELETTNEELQSTNEELETTNEELQSTNEELETTIEELQCTNEELETANDELRAGQEALNSLTRHQETVLAALRLGLITVNLDLVVTGWNRTCEEMWGIRESEALQRDLFSLDIGLNFQSFRSSLKGMLADGRPSKPALMHAINRRGKPIQCQVRINPLTNESGVIGGMLIIEEIEER